MTAQIPEVLILDGTPHPMTFCPRLPSDKSKLNLNIRHEESAKPCSSRRWIARWVDDAGIERAEEEEICVFSTSCWRRYRGTWEIKDARFYLVDLIGRVRLAKPGPLFGGWFTGVLRVPLGDELLYVHMGFGTVYEQEMHVMVEHGLVKGRRVFDNRSMEHDEEFLSLANLPGFENRFPGDRDFN